MCDYFFVARIDELLAKRGINRAELLRRCDLPGSAIVNWKKNGTVPAANILFKIAKELNTDVEYLLVGEHSGELTQDDIDHLERWRRIDAAKKAQ